MRNLLNGRAALGAAALAVVFATACSTDRLLKATDPDIINPSDVQSYLGADAVRLGALSRLQSALTSADVNNGEGIFLLGGLLADEWKSGNTFWQTDEIDQRTIRVDNGNMTGTYRGLHRARVAAIQAIDLLKKFPPAPTSADTLTYVAKIAQMYLVRGTAELYVSESWCNGLAFSDASAGDIQFGSPISTQKGMEMALASFDTALSTLTGTDTLSVRVGNAAKIGRGRALLWLNRFAEARSAVAGIPTSFSWYLSFSQTSGFDNGIWSINNNNRRYSVGDSVDTAPVATTEINALPFVSVPDPRTPVNANPLGSFQTGMPNYRQLIWTTREQAISIFSGLDARLIEAEVDLAKGTSAAYLTTLNALRTGPTRIGDPTSGISISGMAALADPGTDTARVSQFFREKARWQFGRGFRLGDLRRLVGQYGRAQNTVFPTGNYLKGGQYGSDTNFPIPQAEQNNPNYPQSNSGSFNGCTDRNAW